MGKFAQSRLEVRNSSRFSHTDYGTTTLLFSVPVTALQIWSGNRWKYVKYNPGALVINLGETLEGWHPMNRLCAYWLIFSKSSLEGISRPLFTKVFALIL